MMEGCRAVDSRPSRQGAGAVSRRSATQLVHPLCWAPTDRVIPLRRRSRPPDPSRDRATPLDPIARGALTTGPHGRDVPPRRALAAALGERSPCGMTIATLLLALIATPPPSGPATARDARLHGRPGAAPASRCGRRSSSSSRTVTRSSPSTSTGRPNGRALQGRAGPHLHRRRRRGPELARIPGYRPPPNWRTSTTTAKAGAAPRRPRRGRGRGDPADEDAEPRPTRSRRRRADARPRPTQALGDRGRSASRCTCIRRRSGSARARSSTARPRRSIILTCATSSASTGAKQSDARRIPA